MRRYGVKYVRENGNRSTYDAVVDDEKVQIGHYVSDLHCGCPAWLDQEETARHLLISREEFVGFVAWLSRIASSTEPEIGLRDLWLEPTQGHLAAEEARMLLRERNDDLCIFTVGSVQIVAKNAFFSGKTRPALWDFQGEIRIDEYSLTALLGDQTPACGVEFTFYDQPMVVCGVPVDDFNLVWWVKVKKS